MNFSLKFLFILFLIFNSAYAQDVLQLINALPDTKATETTTFEDTKEGLQRFLIFIKQPIDHFNLSLGTFNQKIILLHRDFQASMLLQISGYSIYDRKPALISSMFETNQLQIEYRFYGDSVPESIDWKLLTIRQSAEDFHRVVKILKKLYPQKWVSMGSSKGGQTVIDNRRFYPNDVDGTIANVAPISLSMEDKRYSRFIKNIGGARYSDCRANLIKIQILLLNNKEKFLPTLVGEFNLLGSKEDAFNFTVNEFNSAFWQYTNPEDKEYGCNAISMATEDADKAFNLLSYINAVENYNDENHSLFLPFYIQASYELGYSEEESSSIQMLLPKRYNLSSLIPNNLELTYSNSNALATISWVEKEAKNLLLLYGEFDVWTSGALTKLNKNSDNHKYLVKGGNHKANFLDLPEKEKNEYIAILSRWFNKKAKLE